MTPQILIIEDDEELREALYELCSRSFKVLTAARYAISKESIQDKFFDIILVDLNLPDGDGQDIVELIREYQPNCGVIVISARTGVHERLRALGSGADDFLVKPFEAEELLLRILSVHRRISLKSKSKISIAGVSIDFEKKELWQDGFNINLTRSEFELVRALAEKAGQVVDKRRLVEIAQANGAKTDIGSVDVHMHNVRKKFIRPIIKTIRGVGYYFPNE